MKSFKTIDEAIKNASEDAIYVVEIEPAQKDVDRYILVKCPIPVLKDALKRKPMAEIKRVIGEVANLPQIRFAAKQAKIEANVPGLAGLTAAINEEYRYDEAFERMMADENNDGARPPRKPAISSDDLKNQYPVAAAYIKAEDWKHAAHYAKSAAGQKAMDRIAAGEDYTLALADMEAEWSAHCDAHIWD